MTFLTYRSAALPGRYSYRIAPFGREVIHHEAKASTVMTARTVANAHHGHE
jgi:hypothetical protein